MRCKIEFFLIDSACNCYRSLLKFVKFVYFWDKDVNFDGVYFWLRKTYESLTKHNIETNKSCEMMTLVHALKKFQVKQPSDQKLLTQNVSRVKCV